MSGKQPATGAAEPTEETIDDAIETGEVEEARMILGDRERIRYTGVIRAGKQVPLKKCTEPEKSLFLKLEADGIPYDEINKQMGGKPKSRDSKLTMTNTDHFVIRDCDFKRPADAQYIRDNYADADGKVREIPIWFATGDMGTCIPHNHAGFDGGSNCLAYSYYEGDVLMIKYQPKSSGPLPKKDWPTAVFDYDKPPADAPPVKFGGMYKVNIPGIKSMGEIVVPTHSWYGLGDAIAVLRRVRTVMGRFNGLLNDKPFLKLVKVQETVKTPDGSKKSQWLVTIEISVDPIELAKHADNRSARGLSMVRLLNDKRTSTSEAIPTETIETATLDKGVKTEPAKLASSKPEEGNKKEVAKAGSPTLPNITSCEVAKDGLYALAKKHGLTELELEAYGNFKLRYPLSQETDAERIKKLTAELDKRLQANSATVKARCQELLKETGPGGSVALEPEIEGMKNEFIKLAENNDLEVDHFLAHLTVFSGDKPSKMTLGKLQDIYQQVKKRIDRAGNLDQFRQEIAGNYREITKKAA